MQRSEFQHAIAAGLGRVIQHLQSHDSAPYTDLILDACLHNKAYDPQVEGTHAAYLIEIIQLTPQFEYFRDQILTALAAAEPSEDWDYLHLMYLTINLADDGYPPARDALYARFERDVQAGFTDIAFAVLSLDGLPALKAIGAHSDIDWDYGRLAVELEDEPLDEVVSATADYPAFQTALLSALDERRHRKPIVRSALMEERRKRFSISYAELQHALTSNQDFGIFGTFGILRGWGQHASDEDLLRAAQELLTEQNQERLDQLVTIFAKRPFPLEPTRLIELVHSQTNSESVTALRANTALTHLRHPDVRKLALELLQSDQPDWGMDLLEGNFEEDDWELINTTVRTPDLTREVYHSLGMTVEDIALKYPSRDAVPALLTMYERTPCSHCRERIVQALHILNLLPAHIFEECKFDSNYDLRKLAQNGFIETDDN